MVYIKLEENMDKFMRNKYEGFPNSLKKMIFKSKCRNGKFLLEKVEGMDYIILPEWNDKALKKLKTMAQIRCWKNICVSDNLRENKQFMRFANENSFNIMDGKWLFKIMVDQIVAFIVELKNETLESQTVSILCHSLDGTIVEKIKEICQKVKICNILTRNIKQFQKLEEEIYQANGIILNVSNNYKRAVAKSNIIINFDFLSKDLEKCIFSKNAYMINIDKNVTMDKRDFMGKNIVFFETNMPEKYAGYQQTFEDFNATILYESFIYKRTNYQNIKNEILEDDIKILYLEEENQKKVKKETLNLQKKLDKIRI